MWLIVALIVAALLVVPYTFAKAVLWFDGWRDRRWAVEMPETVVWDNNRPTMADLSEPPPEPLRPYVGASRDRHLSGKARIRARRSYQKGSVQ